MTLLLRIKDKWVPEPVELPDYADDCEYWRQGVSLHVLRQNISDAQRAIVNQPEFSNADDIDWFRRNNGQDMVRCQSSVSSSEVTEQLLSNCLERDSSIGDADFLIYCHRAIDLEFYSSPACRAQKALQNQKIIPFSISQCGTAAGMFGLELAHTLAQQGQKGVVLALNELGIMPARRRILRDVMVNDGASVLHLCPCEEGVEIEHCDIRQFAIEPTCATDLLPAYAELLAMAQTSIGLLDDILHILPRYSRAFEDAARIALPDRPRYIFENRDDGYSGVNFAYNALQEFFSSDTARAVLMQVSETGAGAFCVLRKTD